jgi:hypothetical protein
MSLRENVHRLTREHLTTGPDGKPASRPALLVELQGAVHPSKAASKNGVAGRPLPINADAVDLIQLIKHDAHVDHYELRGFRFRGAISDLLNSYLLPVYVDLSAEWELYLAQVTLDWIDAVDALVRPRKPRRKLSVPCPHCGEQFYGEDRAVCVTANCWGEGEEWLPAGQWDVRCENCGAEWKGDEAMRWFLKSIGQGGVAA